MQRSLLGLLTDYYYPSIEIFLLKSTYIFLRSLENLIFNTEYIPCPHIVVFKSTEPSGQLHIPLIGPLLWVKLHFVHENSLLHSLQLLLHGKQAKVLR